MRAAILWAVRDRAMDSEFALALQSIQRDINCLTHDERGVRRQAIVKLREALLASARIEADPVRRFEVPTNPVALRSAAELSSAPRSFMLKKGDVVEVLETQQVQGRHRLMFMWESVECWASERAGDGGVLLAELPSSQPGAVGGVVAQPGLLAFLLKACQIPLARCLLDHVEKCRELATETLVDIIAAVDDADALFETCLPVVTQRVGLKQVDEPAEEIRLRLVAMLTAFVSSKKVSAELMASKLDAICNVVNKMAADQFPDVKKECASCARALVAENPESIRHHAPGMAKAILLNTGHQHSKVRVASVLALGALVSNGAEAAFDDLAPQFLVLTRDRAALVREVMTVQVSGWLTMYAADKELCPRLLRLMVAGIADQTTTVAAAAVKGLAEASAPYQAAKTDVGTWPDAIEGLSAGQDVAGTVLIREHLAQVLPVLLGELGDWTSKTRVHAAAAMQTLLCYTGDSVTPHLDTILRTMYHAIGDDEIEIVKLITGCVEKLGVIVSIDSWLPLVIEDAIKQTGGGSAATLKFCVACFTALVRGLRTSGGPSDGAAMIDAMKAQLTPMTEFLSNPALCCNSDVAVVYAILQGTEEVIEAVESFGCDEENELRLFISLLHAAARRGQPNLQQEAVKYISRFASVLKLDSAEALYQRHFISVLDLLVGDGGFRHWRSDTPGRALFDILIRGSGTVVVDHFGPVLGVFEDTLQPEREPEMRMSFLVLLDMICRNRSLHAGLMATVSIDERTKAPCTHVGEILVRPGRVPPLCPTFASHLCVPPLSTF